MTLQDPMARPEDNPPRETMTSSAPRTEPRRGTVNGQRKARVIAVANQKGGVAKTTTVASVGAALAELGQRVLLVDLDPQACLTFSLGYDPESIEVSIHHVLLGRAGAADIVIATEEGPDLLPATIELASSEQLLLTRTGREQLLKSALAPLLKAYDVIILDCPPSLGILTTLALTAAHGVLIPLQCETLSHRGVGQLLDTIHDIKKVTNRRLNVIGVLPTLFDVRTSHARLVLDRIGSDYGVDVLQPAIPKSVRFAEAPAAGHSILSSATSSKGAVAYRELAVNLLDGALRG
jgi:chromosome partitioning protein